MNVAWQMWHERSLVNGKVLAYFRFLGKELLFLHKFISSGQVKKRIYQAVC